MLCEICRFQEPNLKLCLDGCEIFQYCWKILPKRFLQPYKVNDSFWRKSIKPQTASKNSFPRQSHVRSGTTRVHFGQELST